MARSMGDLLHPNDPRDAARALRSSSGGGVAAGEGGGRRRGKDSSYSTNFAGHFYMRYYLYPLKFMRSIR